MELFDDLARDYMKIVFEFAVRSAGFIKEILSYLRSEGFDTHHQGIYDHHVFAFYKHFNTRDWTSVDQIRPIIQLLDKALSDKRCQDFIPGLNAILTSKCSPYEFRDGRMLRRKSMR